MTDPDPTVGERLARIETDISHLREESRAVRDALHGLVRTALADHSAAITRLAAAHDQRQGIWWTVAWVLAALVVIGGAVGWLLENQVQIVIKR
jgi:type VI protein secretion system component VasF